MGIAEGALTWLDPLLSILRCPRTGRPLRPIDLQELKGLLTEQELRRVPDGTIGALVAEGSPAAYPVIGRIVDFLEQEVLTVSSVPQDSAAEGSRSKSIKSEVKAWYDSFGWKRSADGKYYDTAMFSQSGQTAHGFYEVDSHLQCLDSLMGGTFLLDAASGALPHAEHASYSWFYKYRVCVDMSIVALQEAAAKVGGRGFCCLADICHLPFCDDAFDGIVSGYTIQHIPESDQLQAIREFYRVLAAGKHCCIMTGFRHSLAGRAMRKVVRPIAHVMHHSNGLTPDAAAASEHQPFPLYCCLRLPRWWRHAISQLGCPGSVHALRLFQKGEFERLFGDSWRAARLLRRIERGMPGLSSRFAQYGLVRFSKTQSHG